MAYGESTVTASQRRALFLGVAIMICMGVYPPWVQIRGTAHRYAYGWLFDPPVIPTSGLESPWSHEIDVIRLLIQWAVVTLATGALIVFFWPGRRD